MSDATTTHTAAPDDHGGTNAHDEHDDHGEHGHGGEVLGPVDVRAWGALALGVAAGLVVALCLLITTVLLEPAAHV